ncbi:Psd1p [Malassezia vespertilionis]|uniref:Phosphatidylserine decarboxylase proenzyme 1, mitochondrial n=2 Tax=Malassezia vespertilionis TaxID=2020962 RepID=A0A2N1JFB2_9BASI|nr:Psd1p [Malassezia vespertilionis]
MPPGARAYTRNPNDAERSAGTVAGQRAERVRLGQASEETPRLRTRRRQSTWRRAQRAWQETPLKWTPIPVLLGAAVLVGIEAHRQWQRNERVAGSTIIDGSGESVRIKGPWSLYFFGALPLNTISRAWGWMNHLTLPVWFRPYGFKLYSWIFDCDLSEMKDPDLTHYESLGAFFSRELKAGMRPIAQNLMVSPADGRVLHLGLIEGDRVEQVKGLTYSLDTLLGHDGEAMSSTAVPPEDSKGYRMSDETTFANVNGIDYSLEELFGHKNPRKSVRTYFLGWAKGSWRYVRQTASALASGKAFRSSNATCIIPDEEPDSANDAGIPTSDTPENIGHIANVAYEMGSEAIPSFINPQTLSPNKVRSGHRLFFAVIYLAPGDYHRFHSPVPWVVEMRRHFRGELYSVSPYVASRLPNLFLLNERVALLGRWRYGFFGMVPIGATNVGSIRINFDRQLRTNTYADRKLSGTYTEATYDAASRLLGGQPLGKGEEMGGFLLGSTVVLVFEAPENFRFFFKAGGKIKVGEALGDVGPVDEKQ